MATDPTTFNANRAALAVQISAASGCDLEIAGIAAGSYLTFPTDSQYGLGDPSPGWAFKYIQAGSALRDWLKVQASAKTSRKAA